MQTLAQIDLVFAEERLAVELPDQSLIGASREPPAPALADPVAAVRAALEAPLGFPPLRQALTPDDHVAVVVDEHLPRLADLLAPVLDYLFRAGIQPEAVTLLCPPSTSSQGWLDDLADDFQEVHVEVHDPSNRRQLSYLAMTRQGRRLYVNRTAVDADQLVVLTGRGYDPLLGYSGAEGALYPALCDDATRQELFERLSMAAPGDRSWPLLREAAEVTWLLGVPFFIQVIEGTGDDIAHVVTGVAETSAEGQRLLDARWRVTVPHLADLVVAGLGGDPARQDFADLARALAAAARVVKPDGRIILLSRCRPSLNAGGELLRQAESPQQAHDLLRQHRPADMPAAFQWAHAVQRARTYLLSGLPPETAEELFTFPLDHPGQVQRLLDTGGSCLFLPDAHKTLALPEDLVSGQS
jgi:nickel-dependent lactate racemase